MSGLKLTLPYAFTGSSAPILRADDMLPAAGALYLLDASHAAGSWPAGVASGIKLPNVAGDQAAKLAATSLDAVLEWDGPLVTMARTAKKGLKFTAAGEVPLPSGNYARFTVPGLADYLHRNPGHSYYLSQWTRAAGDTPQASGAPFFTSTVHSSSTSFLASLYRNNNTTGAYPNTHPTTGGPQFLGVRREALTVGKPAFQSVGVAGWVGAVPDNSSSIHAYPFMAGRAGAVIALGGAWPSLIVYRCYLEDLTVSGRTYAQAEALDYESYAREVLSSGGRYYGDN